MVKPPTWSAIRSRAQRLGARVEHGQHEAVILGVKGPNEAIGCRFVSWTIDARADDLILRTAATAVLEQLEKRR